MPIYEYQCDGCGEVFEVRQKMSDAPPSSHTCGDKRIRRVLSNTSFVLKGTGWYKTDYAEKKPGASQEREGGAKSEGAKGTDAPKVASSDAKGDKSSPKPPNGTGGGATPGSKKGGSNGSQAA